MSLTFSKKLFFVYSLAISVLIAMSLVCVIYDLNVSIYTRDVTATVGTPPLTGFLSNLGIYLWCISAFSCFFAAMILHEIGQKKFVLFLIASGLLTMYLMIDDAFLFHEYYALRIFGVEDKVVFLFLGVFVLVYLKSFIQIILKTKYILLFTACAFLGLSVVIDAILYRWLLDEIGNWIFLIEDGAKWIGIVSWAVYYTNTSYSFIVKDKKLLIGNQAATSTH